MKTCIYIYIWTDLAEEGGVPGRSVDALEAERVGEAHHHVRRVEVPAVNAGCQRLYERNPSLNGIAFCKAERVGEAHDHFCRVEVSAVNTECLKRIFTFQSKSTFCPAVLAAAAGDISFRVV